MDLPAFLVNGEVHRYNTGAPLSVHTLETIVQRIRAQRLSILRHIYRMDNEVPARKCLFNDPEGDKRTGRVSSPVRLKVSC